MKPFDTKGLTKCWDRFDAFYWKVNCFVQFETGELMLESDAESCDYRRRYHDMNIELCATSGMPTKLFTPDGEPLTVASLSRTGIQSFLIDYDHKMAVSVQRGWKIKNPRVMVNKNMDSAPVFYMQKDHKPQSQFMVDVGLPLALTKERMEWRTEVLELAKLMYELQKENITDMYMYYQRSYEYRKGVSPKSTEYIKDPADYVGGLDLETLHFLATKGLSTTYEWSSYDHLIIK